MPDPDISLDLSQEEFALLIEIVFLSYWVVCGGQEVCHEEYGKAVQALEQKLYQLAHRQGYQQLVEFSNERSEFVPTAALEENSQARAALEFFSEDCFWEELVRRYATVEVMRSMTPERWESLGDDKRLQLEKQQEELIRQAVQKHGLHAFVRISAEAGG
ncbi:MAG: hypothetical protein AAF555_09780 [Verrucomicrobiota bacterium]